MPRSLLILLTLPGLASSFMLTAQASQETRSDSPTPVVLDLSLSKLAPQSGQTWPQLQTEAASSTAAHPLLDFTVEESETAATLFGCDCPYHINQLRQMRGQPLLQ